uniref:PQQ-dependent dehydrogenase, methanol/ethanol family n=1 Tax=Paracidobacterium acidisoli TaxID=2303751 RepID=A0A372IJZ7_9BACT
MLMILSGALPLTAQQADRPDAQTNPFADSAAAVAAGRALYQQTCEECHGGDAQGGRGPSLATGSFSHGSEDSDLFRTIRTGIPGTQMPSFSALPADNIWKIITWLRSLSAGSASAGETVPGDPVAGEATFWGKGGCGRCHEVNERGSVLGPDLSAVGKNPAQSLRSVILNPNAPASPGRRQLRPEAVRVTTRNGEVMTGIKRAEDNFTLILMDLNGKLRRLDRSEIVEEHSETKSLMPDNYGQVLSSAEIQNLVAYLKTLKARDLSKTVQATLPPGLTFERLRNARKEPQNWLTYWGNYQGDHFSSLARINPANVGRLQAHWAVQMPPGPLLEATPLVVDGVMYTTYTTSDAAGVYAIDARSGLVIWKYERRQKAINPYQSNPFNRGVAVLGGRVFFGTLDAAMVALDARTGRLLWETQVADTLQGYSITEAPLAIKKEVIVGVAGGEFGIRGFLDAYDAVTGRRLWRFYTVPRPGEPGSETWTGDSWKQGGGPTWMTGSYDPERDVLYWTVGNPGPDMNADVREGANLFTCSVLALDPDTGKLRWYYQFTPGDTHDWDANEDVVLADQTVAGTTRRRLLQADRNGLFYVLDRDNGRFVFAKPYVRQTWNGGFHPDGTPILLPNWKATPTGNIVSPTVIGGADWANPSYDRIHSKLYVVVTDSALGYRSVSQKYEAGRQYMGGRPFFLSGEEHRSGMKEIDTRTGAAKWVYSTFRGSMTAGVLATGGGLVFLATADGNLIALDAASGRALWHFQTGGTIASAPVSYAVDGRQYVAISAGNTLYSFALPD